MKIDGVEQDMATQYDEATYANEMLKKLPNADKKELLITNIHYKKMQFILNFADSSIDPRIDSLRKIFKGQRNTPPPMPKPENRVQSVEQRCSR